MTRHENSWEQGKIHKQISSSLLDTTNTRDRYFRFSNTHSIFLQFDSGTTLFIRIQDVMCSAFVPHVNEHHRNVKKCSATHACSILDQDSDTRHTRFAGRHLAAKCDTTDQFVSHVTTAGRQLIWSDQSGSVCLSPCR
jgi:hypothetical protein